MQFMIEAYFVIFIRVKATECNVVLQFLLSRVFECFCPAGSLILRIPLQSGSVYFRRGATREEVSPEYKCSDVPLILLVNWTQGQRLLFRKDDIIATD
jgi:hypothetical protein